VAGELDDERRRTGDGAVDELHCVVESLVRSSRSRPKIQPANLPISAARPWVRRNVSGAMEINDPQDSSAVLWGMCRNKSNLLRFQI
jgi:hypothetical protein